MTERSALFLDRDGVIIEETGYLHEPDQARLIPRAAEGIARANAAGIPVVVVTNQAGVARGYYGEADVRAVHARIDELLAPHGARIDRYYYCPHHPTAGQGVYRVDCSCRKPQPGMLLQAAAELGLELPTCVLVGDKLSDLQAAWAVGCRALLVTSGYGATLAASASFAQQAAAQTRVIASLEEAVCLMTCGESLRGPHTPAGCRRRA